MNKFLIKNGRVIDPVTHRDAVGDILIVEGVVTGTGRIANPEGVNMIDAAGKLVIPGLVDLHVHLRDMEEADKETIESGTRAARKGGVTSLFAMPNTRPPLDSIEILTRYMKLAEKTAHVRVYLTGSITRGLDGKELTDFKSFSEKLGIKMVTDDGYDVNDEKLLESAYQKAAEIGLFLLTHPEAENEKTGSNEREWKAVERGIKLALKTGAKAHFTHLSTRESIGLVRQAKKESDKITCDITPHHFTFTEKEAERSGTLAKVNPPLRKEADRLALIEGVRDGTVDAIVTDHAPHRAQDKTDDWEKSAYGISGLETLLPAAITELHLKNGIDLFTVIRLMTSSPAGIAGIDAGRLQAGADADLVIVDMEQKKTVDRMTFVSKGKNTPFHGMELKGWPVMTFCQGTLYQ
ncbi:dihydroorotase [Candidatus Peregrinibacteria bacterium]|nr:dihydroorotase [Candidatus Peregrinibacteria bacterium]